MKLPAGKPKPPKHLSKAAREEWNRVVKALADYKILAAVDGPMLATYASLYARWCEAEAKIAEQGAVVTSPNGYPIQNPWLSISNKAAVLMHRFAGEFGLTPIARLRVQVDHQPKAKAGGILEWIERCNQPYQPALIIDDSTPKA